MEMSSCRFVSPVESLLQSIFLNLSRSAAEGDSPHAARLLEIWEEATNVLAAEVHQVRYLHGKLRRRVSSILDAAGARGGAISQPLSALDVAFRQASATKLVEPARRDRLVHVPLGGFLLTREGHGQGNREEAVAEFLAIFGRHTPALNLRAVRTAGSNLSLLAIESNDAGAAHADADAASHLRSLFAAISASDSGFTYLGRVLPVQAVCAANLDAVIATVQRLASPLLDEKAPPTSYAVRFELGGLRGDQADEACFDEEARVAAVAAVVPTHHEVDLKSPVVVVHVRGFFANGCGWFAVAIYEMQGLQELPRSVVHFEQASRELLCYRAGVNNAGHSLEPMVCVPCHLPLQPDGLESWLVRLNVALRLFARKELEGLAIGPKDAQNSGHAALAEGLRVSSNAKVQGVDRGVVALVDALEAHGVLSAATSTLEFGAGRGTLTRHVRQRVPHVSQSVLVDRNRGSGGRVEISGPGMSEEAEGVLRLRIDIRNLWLPGLSESLGGTRMAGLGKHVCGPATDLALRCLCGSLPDASEEDVSAIAVVSVGIALCCHHLCSWEDYVGRQWFEEAGFSAQEFASICRMSSWAVGCVKNVLQQDVGKACKALLDAGRVQFLLSCGLRAKVIDYDAADKTKENRVLIATRVRAVH